MGEVFVFLLEADVNFCFSGVLSSIIPCKIGSTGGFFSFAKEVSEATEVKELPKVSSILFWRNLPRVRGGENIKDPTGYWEGVVKASRTEIKKYINFKTNVKQINHKCNKIYNKVNFWTTRVENQTYIFVAKQTGIS